MYLAELAESGERALYIAAASIALVGVKGATDGDGKPVEVRREVTAVGPLKIRHAAKATLDLFPVEVLIELGRLAVERMAPRPN